MTYEPSNFAGRCNKCKADFTERDLLELNIVSGECPFCAEQLEDKE